jgi:hypothetical protein
MPACNWQVAAFDYGYRIKEALEEPIQIGADRDEVGAASQRELLPSWRAGPLFLQDPSKAGRYGAKRDLS